MFDGLLKSKFYSKCKSAIKRTRTRIEIIRRKRNAMQKYLKNDIVDLLKNGLDFIAYGRVEAFLVELNLSSCYDFVEQSCVCISGHLSIMNKQRECPEECREAIPSLMFAAARFSDLPELRDLRSIFAERYENSLEPYVNREFVEKLKSMPPTKDVKLRFIQDIALESGIEWDSKALEQKLYKPPASEKDRPKNTKDDKYKMHKSRDESVWKIDKDAEYKHSNVKDSTMKERSQQDLSSRGRKEVINDENKLHSRRRENNEVPEGDNKGHLSFETQKSSPNKDIQSTSIDRNGLQSNPKSAKSASKEEIDDKKNLDYRSVPPPYYIKPKVGTNETSLKAPPTNVKSNGHISEKDKYQEVESIGEAKPIPRSVRRIRPKPPPGHGNLESANGDERRKTNSSDKQQDVKQSLKFLNEDGNDQKDEEEERVMDRLLVQYSKKQSPSEPGQVESALKQPPSQQDVKRGSKDGLRSRATSLPTDPTSLAEPTNGHARAASLESEMLNPPGHIHPMLPEYDDFVARLAALRGK